MRIAASTDSLVFNGATVWFGRRRRDWFAGERFVERDFDVVGRTGNVCRIGRGFAVDRAFVNNLSFWINHNHVRRVLRAISASGFAFRIEKQRGLLRFPAGRDLSGLHLATDCPSSPGALESIAQPDDAFARCIPPATFACCRCRNAFSRTGIPD